MVEVGKCARGGHKELKEWRRMIATVVGKRGGGARCNKGCGGWTRVKGAELVEGWKEAMEEGIVGGKIKPNYFWKEEMELNKSEWKRSVQHGESWRGVE